MPRTALFMGPMARKKGINTQEYNSFRTISQHAETSYRPRQKIKPAFTAHEDFNILGHDNEDVLPPQEFRRNKPNPYNVGFFMQNVHLLNEPICDVKTQSTRNEQMCWWNHPLPSVKSKKPEYSLTTTSRIDYQKHTVPARQEHCFRTPTVNLFKKEDGSQGILKEDITFDHHYNCRLEPSYPRRGKRRGAFVWDVIPPADNLPDSRALLSDKTSIQNLHTVIQPNHANLKKEDVINRDCISIPVLPPI